MVGASLPREAGGAVEDRRERLAALAHEMWSGWMIYLFSKCAFREDGSAVMPAWAVERWQRQAAMGYRNLSVLINTVARATFNKIFGEQDDAIASLTKGTGLRASSDSIYDLPAIILNRMNNTRKIAVTRYENGRVIDIGILKHVRGHTDIYTLLPKSIWGTFQSTKFNAELRQIAEIIEESLLIGIASGIHILTDRSIIIVDTH